MFFFKKKKIKKSKYKLRCSDYEITILMNFINDSILGLKNDIEDSNDRIELYSLIKQRDTLINISRQLGFTCFDEDYANKKTIEAEIKALLKNKKEIINNSGQSTDVDENITNNEKNIYCLGER